MNNKQNELFKELDSEFTMFSVIGYTTIDGIDLKISNIGLAKITKKKIKFDCRSINHSDYMTTYDGNFNNRWSKTQCVSSKEHLEYAKNLVIAKLISQQEKEVQRLEKELIDVSSHKKFNINVLKEFLED
jgi:hypothetical protein